MLVCDNANVHGVKAKLLSMVLPSKPRRSQEVYLGREVSGKRLGTECLTLILFVT